MKRLLLVCVVVIMVSVFSNAVCDTVDSIKFRGIDWGISPDEFLAKIEEENWNYVAEEHDSMNYITSLAWGKWDDIIFSPGYKYIVISNVTVQSSCSDLPFPFSAAVLDVFRNLRPPAEK